MANRWSERAVTLAGYLGGSEGPLKRLFDKTRPIGLGERVVKSAVAAVIAWSVAGLIPDNGNPLLAPLTAMFSINLTIAGGMRQGWQRILGVIAGITSALIINWIFGTTAISIGLVVLISFFLGRRLMLEPSGVEQMAVTTLIVVISSTAGNFERVAILHFVNTFIGTAVGLLLNATVAPPNYLPEARRQIYELADELRVILLDLADQLEQGIGQEGVDASLEQAREIARTVGDVERSIETAEESLQYNLIGRGRKPQLEIYRQASRDLEHTAVQTRIIARSLSDGVGSRYFDEPRPDWLEPENFGKPIAQLLQTCAEAVGEYLWAVAGDVTLERLAMIHLRQSIAQIEDVSTRSIADLEGGGWYQLGEITGVATQLVTDLRIAETDSSK